LDYVVVVSLTDPLCLYYLMLNLWYVVMGWFLRLLFLGAWFAILCVGASFVVVLRRYTKTSCVDGNTNHLFNYNTTGCTPPTLSIIYFQLDLGLIYILS
jgi:hypothetical protein